jgi:transmembrane E3 ubiquitin-protein ligase
MKLVLFGLYTWWIPQIVLSAVMDGRQPLKPVYIIGTSAARLALPLYLYGCPANLLRIPPAPRMLAALIASVAAQVWVWLEIVPMRRTAPLGTRCNCDHH